MEIPTGVAHGFLAVEPLTLVYLVTNEYDGTDELGSRGTTATRRLLAAVADHVGRPPDPLRP